MSAIPAQTVSTSAQKCFLTIYASDGSHIQKELREGIYRLGRDPDCEITLDDGSVSLNLAMLMVQTPENVTLRDLGSTNGCFFNEERISDLQVQPGTIFHVGHVPMCIQIMAPAPAQPVQAPVTMQAPVTARPISPNSQSPFSATVPTPVATDANRKSTSTTKAIHWDQLSKSKAVDSNSSTRILSLFKRKKL